MDSIRGYAALKPGLKVEPFEFQPGPLGADEVDIQVQACGICHSDLSMLKNDWENSTFPLIAGHEAVGVIKQVGAAVKNLRVGDTVGVGWFTGSCMVCAQCMSGDHNLCGRPEAAIVGRHGGFADRIRCRAPWALPLPKGMNAEAAGPLFCGGITVFNPILQFDVKPTDRVAVVGIGGLGHLAVQFLNKWGCHVTALTSNPDKADWIRKLGAHEVKSSVTEKDLQALRKQFDFIIVTVNVPLNWELYQNMLAPKGRLHFVGAVLEPIQTSAFTLIGGQKSLSGTGVGSPETVRKMLDFCVRHKIEPMIEKFPMTQINEAIERVESGKARFRVVLIN